MGGLLGMDLGTGMVERAVAGSAADWGGIEVPTPLLAEEAVEVTEDTDAVLMA